jgi:multidrug efflux pump subunit AcrA (membrane-fusion protein)
MTDTDREILLTDGDTLLDDDADANADLKAVDHDPIILEQPTFDAVTRTPRRQRRLRLAGAAAALVAVATATVLVDRVVSQSDNTYTGFVASTSLLALNFKAEGTLQQVLVTPGERVKAGQTLAIESGQAALRSVVSGDNAAVSADQAAISALQAELAQASGSGVAAAYHNAQQAVSSSQAGAQSAAAQWAATINADEAQVSAADNQVSRSQVAQEEACAGPASTSQNCAAARSEVIYATEVASGARQTLVAAQNSARSAATAAHTAEANAQNQLQSAERALAPAESSAAGVQLHNEQAVLARDEAQATRDAANVVGMTIVAPTAGVVVTVNGTPGSEAGSAGVRQVNVAAGSTLGSPGFSLLPQAAGGAAATGATDTTDVPVITLSLGPSTSVIAEVPEGRLSHLNANTRVTVSVPAMGVHGARGSFAGLAGGPYATSNGAVYDVLFKLVTPLPASVLPGMSVNFAVVGR